MKLKRIIKLAILVPIIAACDDLFEPNIENNQDFEQLTKIPENAAGLAMHGYSNLPYQSGADNFSDVATDDAVINDLTKDYWKVGNGLWSSKQGGTNPLNRWSDARTNLQYVNRFLEEIDKFKWANRADVNEMFKDQIRGEALALRGLQTFYFLRAHAGYAKGELLGIPLLTRSETAGDNFNIPRATFKECIEQIFKDLDAAIELLPYDYADINNSEIPAKYKSIGITNAEDYNRVFGSMKQGRMSGRIASAIKAQVALFAASPAYSDQSGVTYADAAKYAGQLLNTIGGVSGLDINGNHWYNNIAEIRGLNSGSVPAEIIWRGNISETNSLETDCYPASLFGKAKINPSQNLVNAFPMANGYPITESASGYNAQNPYKDRDPRFELYIVHDGMTNFGPYRNDKNKPADPINTTIDDENNIDGLDAAKGNAPTRTGYFMRKLLNEDCIIKMRDGGSGMSAQIKYDARIRYTEIFLAYAEAANEAYGPTGTSPELSNSAYDVIKAIRDRGRAVRDSSGLKIESIPADEYLESIKVDKDKMRELIRNERRIELCFEGHRFWDLRRWKANLNEPIKAMRIETINGKKTYEEVEVKNEIRNYDDCMYYGPIPESELNKWSALIQNDGWERF